MKFFINIGCAIFCLVIAVPTLAVDRNQLNSTITINYGLVLEVEQIKVKSGATKNALVGGMLGAATSGHHDRGKHAATGAAAAILLTKLAESRHKANAYTVEMNSGSTIKILLEDKDHIQAGDCVSVEQGRSTNIRRVSTTYCEHHGHEALAHNEVVQKAQQEADACHQAKEIALKAHTEDELNVALKKVNIFCEH